MTLPILLNRERANSVMDNYGLDFLLVREKNNVYYFSNYYEPLSEGGWPFAAFALLPRDKKIPPSLVIPSISLQRLDKSSPTWMENIYAYSDYSGRHLNKFSSDDIFKEPKSAIYEGWPNREKDKLNSLEMKWTERRDEYRNKVSASPIWSLHRLFKDIGFKNCKIGTDDIRVINWLQETGFQAIQGIDALNIIREIRIIKTPAEIELLRQAAKINEKATLEAIHSIKVGSIWPEIVSVYAASLARSGARIRYLNTYLGGLPNEKVVYGEPFFIDALGEFRSYLADFGRSVVVGSPSKELEFRMNALKNGFKAALDILRPGIKKSQIAEKIIKEVRSRGFKEFFNVTPHSLGLEHTDSPIPVGLETNSIKNDFLLQEGMVINIDMPHVEYGWGAIHIEDTLLLTKDGFEPLTSLDTDLIILN